MAKTLPPGEITIPGVETPFVLNVLPDTFDERDLEYRPRLQPLPRSIDNRDQDKAFFVLEQKGNSCTGHAIAAVINTILAQRTRKEIEASGKRSSRSKEAWVEMLRVSPYMLYYLARRYDEFEGEEDIGSSLRGAFKGWFHHGVCLETDWPALDFEADLDVPDFARKCQEYPLGAYYRINPYRLDDMQSAISELDAITVSATIHDGWIKPEVLRNERGQEMHVIRRSVRPKLLGGHAFTIVGYNDVGFLVQNSWGPKWAKGGFATLPYEDWLDSAYDAWVARPGVPQTPFYSGRARTFAGTNGSLVTGKAPDLKRLAHHVVNLGNDGLLSIGGKFRSSPAQIERIFTHMDRWHTAWSQQDPKLKRHIILYAHGGMVSEKSALEQAQSSVNWWLNNKVYPVYFAWQTGPGETLFNQIFDAMKARLPAGGLGFDLEEQFDRLVERLVRRNFFWAWEQMKQNARAASAKMPKKAKIVWPPDSASESAMLRLPGASLVISRLAQYIEMHGEGNIAVHLVGHSAGSIFHAGLLERLVDAGIRTESLTFLAPGLRVDEFQRDVLRYLGPENQVKKFSVFNLSDELEMADSCSQSGLTVYHKSLLYLVSRALERPPQPKMFETPLMGLERSLHLPARPESDETVQDLIAAAGGTVVFARSQAPVDHRCEADTHGSFDNDPATMTSVLLRALGLSTVESVHVYEEHASLVDGKTLAAALEPTSRRIEVSSRAAQPLAETAATEAQAPVEVAEAPVSGSPIVDILQAEGWTPVEKSDGRTS